MKAFPAIYKKGFMLCNSANQAETVRHALAAEYHLGVGLSLGFDQLRFVMSPRAKQTRPLSAGQFVIAMVSTNAANNLHAPCAESMIKDMLILLRTRKLGGLPADDERDVSACRDLLAATMPQGMAWNSAELGWGILECDVLGSYSLHHQHQPTFSSNLVFEHPALYHHLYQPSPQIMEMITNGTLQPDHQIELGVLRSGEDLRYRQFMHPARVSMMDIRGKRTAMFGKTRLGKSNVVKLIAQGMLDVTAANPHVGQIIFDVNGEYANTNPQDGETALAQIYKSRCNTYFLTENHVDPAAKLLRFNFYQRSDESLTVMSEVLPDDVVEGADLRNLFTCRFPKLERLPHLNDIEFRRMLRKWMLFWTLLEAAGCQYDTNRMKDWLTAKGLGTPFNPGYSANLRAAAYLEVMNKPAPSIPFDFPSMLLEMRTVAKFASMFRNDPSLNPHGRHIFDSDEEVLIGILCGNGHVVELLRPCMVFHSPEAGNFTEEILAAVDESKTVIINLSSAGDKLLRYFARSICTSLFHAQERKFSTNSMNGHYVQVYFEEAHNIFPAQNYNHDSAVSIYSRFAKEGAKFHIGIVYCTQSPSSVSKDLLAQTENFFIGHLSCTSEANYLSDVQRAFVGCESHILRNRTPGYMQVLTFSHRYVVPVQAHMYTGEIRVRSNAQAGMALSC